MMGQKMEKPCGDCDDGVCTMNCGPRACAHEFDFKINVIAFENKPGQGSIEMTGVCRRCKEPLVFYGPRGAGSTQPMASVDRLELRAPVTFGYGPKFTPPPEFVINGLEIVGGKS